MGGELNTLVYLPEFWESFEGNTVASAFRSTGIVGTTNNLFRKEQEYYKKPEIECSLDRYVKQFARKFRQQFEKKNIILSLNFRLL